MFTHWSIKNLVSSCRLPNYAKGPKGVPHIWLCMCGSECGWLSAAGERGEEMAHESSAM